MSDENAGSERKPPNDQSDSGSVSNALLSGEWGDPLRYKTDDCDMDDSELVILQGGNGDWYVGIAPEGQWPERMTRVRTSGSSCPPLGWALADCYRALRGDRRADEVGGLYDAAKEYVADHDQRYEASLAGDGSGRTEPPSCPCETCKAAKQAIEMYEMRRMFAR